MKLEGIERKTHPEKVLLVMTTSEISNVLSEADPEKKAIRLRKDPEAEAMIEGKFRERIKIEKKRSPEIEMSQEVISIGVRTESPAILRNIKSTIEKSRVSVKEIRIAKTMRETQRKKAGLKT